jgi:YD repeat-containing protein
MTYEEMALVFGFPAKYDEKGNCIYKESPYGDKKEWCKYDKNNNMIYKKELDVYGEDYVIDEYIWKYDKNNNVIYEKSIYYDLDEISEEWYDYDKNGRLIHIKRTSTETVDEETWYKYDKYDNIIYSKTINTEYWYGYDENGNIVYYRECKTNNNDKFFVEDYEEWYIYNKHGKIIKEFHHDKNNDYYIKYNENGEMHKKWKNGDEEYYDKYGSLIKIKRISNKTEIRIPINIYY